MRRSVLIVGDRRKAGVPEAVEASRPFLERRLDVLAVDLDEALDLSRARSDLVLVFGGDGSILHVARRLGANPLPVLGVNYGLFGFLTDLEPGDLERGVERWLEGAYETSERRRLLVRLLRGEQELARALAFNDVVIGRQDLGGMVDVDVGIDGRPAVTFSGDGLIVATATGSTAHALAAGGPLVEPTADAVLLVPVAPHALSARPLVVASTHHVQLSIGGRQRPAGVTIDGTAARVLERGERVDVSDAHAPLTLVHASGRSFYDALRRKLGWRGRSNWGRATQDAWEERGETGGP